MSYSTIVDIVDNKPPEPRLLSAWLRLDPNETGDAYAAQVKAEVLRVAEEEAADAVEALVTGTVDAVMNVFNTAG